MEEMPKEMREVSESDYKRDFAFGPSITVQNSIGDNALKTALDVRKFEIELYWKRATYFWTFLTLILGAYFTVSLSKVDTLQDKAGRMFLDEAQLIQKQEALLILCCLGFVFAVCWYFVNRASKYWQENWEKHVDLLEDGNQGPLYKTVIHDDKISFFFKPWGAYPFSVSKLNQILSFFIVVLFAFLLTTTVARSYGHCWFLSPFADASLIIMFVAILTLVIGGQTSKSNVRVNVWRRELRIIDEEKKKAEATAKKK
jgi:hypothetical protein